jgi:GT2 family glycosyltransferase
MTGPDGQAIQARIDAAYTDWVRARAASVAATTAVPPLRTAFGLVLQSDPADTAGMAETLRAVRAQHYPHWTLIVAGAEPSDLAACGTADRRVRARPGIESALAEADGDFVLPLRAGDMLAPHALADFAAALARRPDVDILYADEDRLDAAGARCVPRLKPGWDPDRLLAENYLGAPLAIRATLLARLGEVPASPHALALRATAATTPDRIAHLPAILLHRPLAAPDEAADAVAVADAVGKAGRVVPAPSIPGACRVLWHQPDPSPLVSLIVPVRDRADLMLACAEGVLHRTEYPAIELLIVDNDSAEPATHSAFRRLSEDARVRVLPHPGGFNFAALNNAAADAARGDVLLLLNNDTEVTHPGWLWEMVTQALRPEVGAVGARLLYADGRLQHGGIVLAPGGHAAHWHRLAARDDPGYRHDLLLPREVLAVTAACLSIRRDVFREAGGFDAQHFRVAFNDVDLCLRLRERGYRNIWTPHATLLHLESASRGPPATHAERTREAEEVRHLRQRWRHMFAADRFLNGNLTCSWDEPLHLAPLPLVAA